MDNFNLRKYLAENILLKESEDIYGEIDAAERGLERKESWGQEYADMWLFDLANASDDELQDENGDYLEIAKVLDNVFLHRAEVMDNVRQWAKLKLNPLNESQDLVSRIGDLEDILWDGSNRRAEKEWEITSGEYLSGEEGNQYWADLDDYDLRSAIDDAEHIMKKYEMGGEINEARKFKNKEEVVDALVKDFGKNRKSYYNTPTNSNIEKYWTYNRTAKSYYNLVKKEGYRKSFDNMFKGTTPSNIDF